MTTTLDKFFSDKEVEVVYIQTVFEGHSVNTLARAKYEKNKWKLTRPIGHDVGDGRRAHFMTDFRTGGTPWTVIVDKKGAVRFNDFTRDYVPTKRLIEGLLEE